MKHAEEPEEPELSTEQAVAEAAQPEVPLTPPMARAEALAVPEAEDHPEAPGKGSEEAAHHVAAEAAYSHASVRASRSAPLLHLRLTRRQLLLGGAALGLVGVSVCAVLAVSQPASLLAGAPGASGAATPTGASSAPTIGTTPNLAQQLDAWRRKHLTAAPALRFTHQAGGDSVPLGVVDPVYPNPYNPYQVRLQGYLLGGEVIARTQLFWYLGLEAIDGTQFVGKFRVGPIAAKPEAFGIQVTEQSNDFIEGGGTPDYPITPFAPSTFAHSLAALSGHCLVVTLLRQRLPPEAAEDIPAGMLAEINQQAAIADQFAQFDVDVVQHTPFAKIPPAEVDPIQALIDPSPISYHSSVDASRYPLVTQITLRQSDQLFPKLASSL